MFLMPDTASVSLENVASLLFVDRQYKELFHSVCSVPSKEINHAEFSGLADFLCHCLMWQSLRSFSFGFFRYEYKQE